MLLWTSFLAGSINARPVWQIEGPSAVNEGAGATYTVFYDPGVLAPGETASVEVSSAALAGGFPNAAGGDYSPLITVLTFTGGGVTARTVRVSTLQDTIVEGTEDFRVTLGTPTVGTIAVSQVNTVIVDDDAGSLVWAIAGPTSVDEGNTTTFTVSYTGVTLVSGQTATVSVASADLAGGDTNATAGVDYTAIATVLTFTGGGATSRTVAVSTIEDTVLEGTEDFRVTLAAASIGTLGTSQANIVIVDDDAGSVVWSIAGATSVDEGDTATFTVSYTGVTLAPGQTMTIAPASANLSGGDTDAGIGTDYTALSTTLTFTGGGSTAKTVAVSTIEDTDVEGTEDFRVTIAGQSAGTLVASQANAVIVDDDAPPSLSWSIEGTTSLAEGATGTYTVSYDGASIAPGVTETIVVASVDGDAEQPDDYTALSVTLTFTGGGATAKTVAVSTINDTESEGAEDFTVTISAPSSGALDVDEVVTLIASSDNDIAFVGMIGGNSGNGNNVVLSLTALTGGIDTAARTDDLVVLIGGHSMGAGGVANAGSPSGYTQRLRVDTGTSRSFYIGTKFMGLTPDTTVTGNGEGASDGSDSVAYVARVYRNVNPTTEIDAAAVSATGSSTNPDAPSITVATAGAALITAAISRANDTAATPPSGYTAGQFQLGDDTRDVSLGAAHLLNASTGPSDPGAWSGWNTGAWTAAIIALRPL